VTVLPLGEDGKLGAATAVVKHSGSGPNPDRQEAPHVHSAILAPGGSLALVADLGIDQVKLYDLDMEKGTLAPHAVPALELKPGTGPRHMAFSPDGRFLYVVGELLSTVTVYQYDSAAQTFQEVETQPLLPADFKGQNTSADIHLTPNGKFLYASNRGHNSLAVFTVDPSSGKLSLVDHTLTQGKTPRNFAIDPTGAYLLVANQDSGSIVTFKIDPASGKLEAAGKTTEVAAPVCIKFLVR
jgi:6-phosphogluconolactonase